jgi:hypothetical protein
MATIQDLKDAVTRETEVVAGVVVLLNGLSKSLKDAIASNDPQAMATASLRLCDRKSLRPSTPMCRSCQSRRKTNPWSGVEGGSDQR